MFFCAKPFSPFANNNFGGFAPPPTPPPQFADKIRRTLKSSLSSSQILVYKYKDNHYNHFIIIFHRGSKKLLTKTLFEDHSIHPSLSINKK